MSDDRELQDALALVRRRWLTVVALRSGARAALGVALVVLVGVVTERLLAPVGPALVMLAAATALAALVLAWRVAGPLRRAPTDQQVARFIEERCPELEDGLATAVDSGSRRDISAFAPAIIDDAVRRLRTVDLDRLVSRRARRRSAWQAAGGLAVLGVSLTMALAPAERAWRTLAFHLFPVTLSVDVDPGDARVVTGRPLAVRAQVRGIDRLPAGVVPLVEYGADGARLAVPMEPDGAGWRFEFPPIHEGFRYRVTAAGTASREFEVTAVTPPRVDRIDVRYEYPAFTGLAPRLEEDGGDIYGPAGTNVTLSVRADRPIDAGEMVFGDGTRRALERDGDDTFVTTLRLEQDASYRVSLRDADGLRGGDGVEYFIRTVDDRPPEVRIVRPGGDRQVTPLEEVRIEARAEDDYGIAQFELVYAVRGGEEIARPLWTEGSATSQTGAYTLLLEDLDVEPGDFITYYARARDVSRGRRSTESRSDIFFLEVRPFHEEFFAAQSQAMPGAGGGDATLDQLAAAQKEIIIATWRLDRRAAAGRSHEDIRAVASAQGELRAKAVQAAGSMGRPSRRVRPGQTADSQDDEPMALAIEAMGRARDALDAVRTAEAIPHAMEALNQLLRAQAAIRQRQVANQQAGAGGGSRQQGHQDLSTLFDRELQRQQQTNYETRSSAADQPPRGDDAQSEALARVRELARRQDELSRQQQDLAARQANMTEDELRRQLERLTREQSELRRQAEELAQELSRQQDARAARQDGGEPASGGSSGDDGMREVAEQMQGAASGLRREDAQGAAESAGRARDGLRAIERQLRGADPDERRRLLGEVGLEARQIAEAQRRIADEARRLDEGVAGTDARRRLVGDKERLADRVERLEQSVRELATGGSGDERGALSDAAGTLEREQVSRRMRETAGELRREDATAGSETAPTPGRTPGDMTALEQRMVQTLDRVAEELSGVGAARDHESQRLSDQLAETRSLRERLAELERRIEVLARGPDAADPGADSGAPPSADQARGEDGRLRGEEGAAGSGGADAAGELARLQAEYEREVAQVRELLHNLHGGDAAGMGATPEEPEHLLSAPGTEAFKQDFAAWDGLRRDVHSALAMIEAELSGRFADRETRDRLNAGADERTPEEYRRLVEKYYQALARKKP